MGLAFDLATMGTGVDSIDTQHRALFVLINDLSDAIASGRGKDEVGKVLDELAEYAIGHFSHEESCMVRFGCPVAAQNKSAHRAFLLTFIDLKGEFERTGPTAALADRVEQEISRWIRDHIVGVDVRLRACVPAGVRA